MPSQPKQEPEGQLVATPTSTGVKYVWRPIVAEGTPEGLNEGRGEDPPPVVDASQEAA